MMRKAEQKQVEDPAPAWKINLNRQLEEVEVLRSIYGGEGEFELTTQEEAILESLSYLDDGGDISKSFYISFTINLLSSEMGGRHISVGLSMPHGYPEKQAVSVTVKCGGGVSRSEHEVINMGAREVACEHIGQEAVLQVLQRVQGEKASVDTYLKQLQNLRWQAMSVRGEEEEEVPHGKEIDDMRHFLKGIKEVDEHGMSELGRFCREANLEHLFLSALKISR